MIYYPAQFVFYGLYAFEEYCRREAFSGSCFDVFIIGKNQVLF